jgi:hypothetical protein
VARLVSDLHDKVGVIAEIPTSGSRRKLLAIRFSGI